MNKNRFPMLVVLVSLVAVAAISILTFLSTTRAAGSNRAAPVGIGDLRVYESKQILPNTGASKVEEKSPSKVVGIGDLRVYEAGQVGSNSAGQKPAACPNASTSQGEHDAGASAPAYVLKAAGCPAP